MKLQRHHEQNDQPTSSRILELRVPVPKQDRCKNSLHLRSLSRVAFAHLSKLLNCHDCKHHYQWKYKRCAISFLRLLLLMQLLVLLRS